MMRFDRVDPERRANMPRRQHPGGGLDQPVAFVARQFHAVVRNAVDAHPALEQPREHLLAHHRVVGEIMVILRVAMEVNAVFDFVFGEHDFKMS